MRKSRAIQKTSSHDHFHYFHYDEVDDFENTGHVNQSRQAFAVQIAGNADANSGRPARKRGRPSTFESFSDAINLE